MAQERTIRTAIADYLGRLFVVNPATRWALRGGISVFMFHRVLPQAEDCYDPGLAISTEAFADTLDWLSNNFNVLPLDTAVKKLHRLEAKEKPLCAITFDDGWLDNFLYAFPLLRERGLPATIFLPVRFIGTNRRFWQERLSLCLQRMQPVEYRQALIEEVAHHFPWFPLAPDTMASGKLKRFLMTRPSREAEEFADRLTESAGLSALFSDRAFLNWDEVLQMRDSGICFGSHTLNHVLLTNLDPEQTQLEIQNSRRELQEQLNLEVSSFSYPWGAAGPRIRDIVRRAGYGYALTTRPGGLAKGRDDLWLLPRIAIDDSLVKQAQFHSGKAFLSCGKSVFLAEVRRAIKRRDARNTARIKIVFVIDQISEWEGGTERQLYTLIKVLDRNYFDPELCFIFRAPGLNEETLPCKAQWICPDPSRKRSFVVRIFRLASLLRRMRPQIVQTFFLEGIVAGILAGRLAGVSAVVGSRRNAGHFHKMRHQIAFRMVANLAHVWQCNSRTMWIYARDVEGISPDRIELLPNAIDLTYFTPAKDAERHAMRLKLGFGDDGLVFVSVAALTAVKDLRTLIDAAKQIRPHLGTAHFLVVGDGPLRDDLETYSKALGLTDIIHFLGRQSDVRPYLAAADFGVLTSKSEGSSNSVLEYMAMGLPSIVSDIAPNRELVNGLLFKPGDSSDLAEKLILISKDATLRSALRSEYLNAASQYSLENFAVRAQSYYSRLAESFR